MGIGRLRSESKRFPCYAEEVRLILEHMGLMVMNLEFGKIAPVMVRRLDWGKQAKLNLKKSQESVTLVQARSGEGRTRLVAKMMKITGLGAARKEGSTHTISLWSQLQPLHSVNVLLPPSSDNHFSQALKGHGSIPALYPHQPNKFCSI